MNFTGTNLVIKRNIYPQTGNIGLSLTCIVDNTTGIYNFGLSGTQGIRNFSLISGKIYQNNTFLHTYVSNQSFNLNAEFNTGNLNIIKDNTAVSYGLSVQSGVYDYFYFSRANAGMNAIFDLFISGDNIPNFNIQNQGYLLYSGQDAVTGTFNNLSANYYLNVFNSEISASQNYSFGILSSVINPLNSGIFAYSGDYSSIDVTQPILTTFNTNAGDIDQLFQIIDARTFSKFVYLTGPTDFTFNSNSTLSRNLTYINYSGGLGGANYPVSIIFSLQNLNTGMVQINSFNYLTTGYGNFLKSGLLTGLINTSTGNIIENITGWATGTATGIFQGIGSGIASGYNFTGSFTGTFTGLYTGFIYQNSGILNVSGQSLLYGICTGDQYKYLTGTYSTGYLDFTILTTGADIDFFGANNQEMNLFVSSINQCAYNNAFKGYTGFFINVPGLVQLVSGISYDLELSCYSTGNYIFFTSTVPGTTGNNAEVIYENYAGPGQDNLLIGGHDRYSTGRLQPIGLYSGVALPFTITGSGYYQQAFSGISYTTSNTATGTIDFLTGVNFSSLVSMNIYNSTSIITGSGIFPSNSSISLQVVHSNISGQTFDSRLIISGSQILNPINQLVNQ